MESSRQGEDFPAAELDYCLPEELIAQHPLPRRDQSRMLVVNRTDRSLSDQSIREFPTFLRGNDVLVLNDTKVIPARFRASRRTGGQFEGLFLEESPEGVWTVMLERSRRLRVGEEIHIGDVGVGATIIEKLEEGAWRLRLHSPQPAHSLLSQLGLTPLPPYIHRDHSSLEVEGDDRSRYQTVYARSPGAVAAPTAGLHLTEEILTEIRGRGTTVAFVTLHVGPGTFKPITAAHLSGHVMHYERYEVTESALTAIENARGRGGRIVAVGTTVVRVLESALGNQRNHGPLSGSTNLFIYPPYQFSAVDVLLTNFHLPRSTLLALVMAFAGKDLTRRAYDHAIAAGYRFYSFGDATLIGDF